jgi:hypothetical protein
MIRSSPRFVSYGLPVLLLAMSCASLLVPELAAGGDSTIQQDARKAGHVTGKALREVGQGLKQAGKEIGSAAKQGGKEFRRAVKGESR